MPPPSTCALLAYPLLSITISKHTLRQLSDYTLGHTSTRGQAGTRHPEFDDRPKCSSCDSSISNPALLVSWVQVHLDPNPLTIIGSNAIRSITHLFSCLDIPLAASQSALTPHLTAFVSDFPAQTYLDSSSLLTNIGNTSHRLSGPRACTAASLAHTQCHGFPNEF